MNMSSSMMNIKSMKSKINFALHRNPWIEKMDNPGHLIPASYKAVVTLTADFELAWAWRFARGNENPQLLASKKAKKERKNIPNILALCEKYQIPITWASVGHLFLDECSNSQYPHPEITRLPYFENDYWRYASGDWFEDDPCCLYKNAPDWYAPDLISMILSSKVQHELACHTFSHIDCRDGVCNDRVFEDEIHAWEKAAAKYGIKTTSFVHPAHTIGNLSNLKKMGFMSYQTNMRNTLGLPQKDKFGLWELKRTQEFDYRDYWSIRYHQYRYKEIIDRAIESGTVCNLWFHPSFSEKFVELVLPTIFAYLQLNSDKVYITTVGKYIEFLERKHEENQTHI
jgi:hypothetical protein